MHRLDRMHCHRFAHRCAAIAAAAFVAALPLRAQLTTNGSRVGDVVRAYMRAYNAHDIKATLAFLAPDFAWLSVVGDSIAVEARGVAAVQTKLQAYFRRLPSAHSEIESLTSLGSWVSVTERAHWIVPTGARSQASVSIYDVRGGQIRRVWYYPEVRDSSRTLTVPPKELR